MSLIHAEKYRPRVFPIKGDTTPAEIDRAQSIDPSSSLNREEILEIGRVGNVGHIKRSPDISYSLTQYENGNIEFWQKLINNDTKGNIGETAIQLTDFASPYFDICGYLTDDDDVFKGTLLYPGLRTSGFTLSIGEPQGIIERSFDLEGNAMKILQNNNKYYIYKKKECGSGSDNEIDLSAKSPVEDPDNSGSYMFRVVRVRSGTTTELESSDYSYDSGTEVLTINSVETDDIIKVYYTSSTAPDTMFSLNDTDAAALTGEAVSIYLYVPGSGKPSSDSYLYRIQNVDIDVSFDREDNREMGNVDIVQRGITKKTVTVSLGKILDDFTLEEVLRGQGADYGVIDVSKLSSSVSLIVKIFDSSDKTSFNYGFLAEGLSPTELGGGASVNEYIKRDNSLEGSELKISKDTSVLGI